MEGLDFLPEDMVVPFSNLTQLMADKVTDLLQQRKEEEEEEEARFFVPFFGGYGGCNDAFSGFGFLAFLLALLDLILELQDDDGAAARRRRSGRGAEDDPPPPPPHFPQEEAWRAGYSVYRGFLNALATSDEACARRFLCEGSQEAAAAGSLGRMIATVASINAATWLTRYEGAAEAGLAGVAGAECGALEPQCHIYPLPPTYTYPRVHTPQAEDDT